MRLPTSMLANKKFDEAEKVIRAGLQQQPDSSAMHMAYAGVLEQKGDYDAAIAEYENLLKQDPGSLIVANNLASLLSDRRTDKASLERAYSLGAVLRKSQVPNFKDTLGWIDYLRGDYKSATALLEEAAAALPNRRHSSISSRHELHRHWPSCQGLRAVQESVGAGAG